MQYWQKVEGKAISLQAWTGPEGYRRLGLTDFMTTAYESVKIEGPKHRLPLPQGNMPGTLFF